MSTEKLNEGQSVRVERDQDPPGVSIDSIDGVNILPEEVVRTRKRFWLVLNIIGLFFTLICLARVPYAGSYMDSYAFEFIFGNVKYAIYLLLIILFIFKIFHIKAIKLFRTKRFLLGYMLLTIGFILTLAIVQKYLLPHTNNVDLHSYINNFINWANARESQTYQAFFPNVWPQSNTALDAGVIGTSLVVAWQYVAAFLLGLVALLLILIAILIFINRTDSKGVTLVRRWLIHLLGGNLYDNTYDELSGEKNDVEPIIHHSVQIKQEANKLGQITPPISFLTDTSIDHYYDNKSQAQKVQQTISKFIKKLGIDSAYQNTVIMPQYAEISFDVPSQKDIDEILKSQAELLNLLKVDRFNISFKGNLVKFEIPNKLISKISIRQILNSIQNFHPHEAIAGLTYDNTPLVVNVDKHPNIIIIGRRGSGAAMLLTVLLITLAYANKPSELEYVLISPLGDKSLKYLDNLPQMQSFITDQVDECIMKLHQMLAIIEDRENKFKEIGAKTLAEHNNYQSNAAAKLKMIVLTISTFDYLLKNSLQNVEILQTILKRGPSVGVKTILLAINVNNESIEPKIYDQTSARFILRLESEHESLKIFDSYRGIQLNGNGDGYYFDEVDNKKIRFQSCYLNVNELAETVKVIKTFYETKEQLNH